MNMRQTTSEEMPVYGKVKNGAVLQFVGTLTNFKFSYPLQYFLILLFWGDINCVKIFPSPKNHIAT